MTKDTIVVKIDKDNIDFDKIQLCADVIKRGGLVCFPTETVYGLGANAFNSRAVDNIFIAKGRPADNPLIVHVSDNDMLELVTDCDLEQRDNLNKLSSNFWPGPLTLIVHRDDAIPENVSCGLDTVGVRFPSHPIAQALISASGVPIAAPSANLSGRPSPTMASHVIEDMMGRVDVIIDGGNCDVGVESTVFDISGERLSVLRPGAVTLEQLIKILPGADELDWKKPFSESGEKPRSPGLKYRHYAPKASVSIYDGEHSVVLNEILKAVRKYSSSGVKCGVLCTSETEQEMNFDNATVISLGSVAEPMVQAANLFSALRKFDDLDVEVVFAEALPLGGAGDAVMNRLYRSAGGRIINV